MMVDLSPANRLTRKRNMLLQKQLGVRLQILADEYRLTKKDLEKDSKELGVFLMCLRDKAPGLSSYGQPDTRAMNAKNILRDQKSANSKKKDAESDALFIASKQGSESKKHFARSGDDDSDSVDGESGKPPPPPRSNKNEFFNRRIVLDSKRRSFLQHNLVKDGGGKPPDLRQQLMGGASSSHSGFLSNRDTAGEASSKPRPQSSSAISQRSRTPRYGSEAYSERDENMRQQVMGRFDVIFDPQNVNHARNFRRTTPAATPLYLPITPTIPEDDSQSQVNAARPPPGPSSSGYIFNRRVAWSAPPKRRETPPSGGPMASASSSSVTGSAMAAAAAASRQNLSVTPRSGTAGMANRQLRSSSASCARRSSTTRDGRGIDAPPIPHPQPGDRRDGSHRPKTAPPVYQLMQKSVAAPRQQVAGILAEIQSRRADTRAMLMKSKQLKKMVKSLAPDEKDEDSFSD